MKVIMSERAIKSTVWGDRHNHTMACIASSIYTHMMSDDLVQRSAGSGPLLIYTERT